MTPSSTGSDVAPGHLLLDGLTDSFRSAAFFVAGSSEKHSMPSSFSHTNIPEVRKSISNGNALGGRFKLRRIFLSELADQLQHVYPTNNCFRDA